MAFYDGTVIADGTPDAVLSNPEVQTLISGAPRSHRAAPHA
jgi:branched-chain amino acid transport system ATP-binding protein